MQISWGPAAILPQKTIVRVWEDHTVPGNSVKRVIGVLTEPMRKEYNIKAKAEDNLIILRTLHKK